MTGFVEEWLLLTRTDNKIYRYTNYMMPSSSTSLLPKRFECPTSLLASHLENLYEAVNQVELIIKFYQKSSNLREPITFFEILAHSRRNERNINWNWRRSVWMLKEMRGFVEARRQVIIEDCLRQRRVLLECIEICLKTGKDELETINSSMQHLKISDICKGAEVTPDNFIANVRYCEYQPSPLLRQGVKIAKYALIGLIMAHMISSIKIEVIISESRELMESLQVFWEKWIWDPLLAVWNTMRYREKKLIVANAETLKADIASLERMIVAFAQEKNMLGSVNDLQRQVNSGDLSVILKHYEDDIKRPIVNIFTGDLIRLILIQVQKSKVDLETAMVALDKLLRANELNFEMLAVFPILTLSIWSYYRLKKAWLYWFNRSTNQQLDEFRDQLRLLDVLLDKNKQNSELHSARYFMQMGRVWRSWWVLKGALPGKLWHQTYEDLCSLMIINEGDVETGKWIIQRTSRTLINMDICRHLAGIGLFSFFGDPKLVSSICVVNCTELQQLGISLIEESNCFEILLVEMSIVGWMVDFFKGMGSWTLLKSTMKSAVRRRFFNQIVNATRNDTMMNVKVAMLHLYSSMNECIFNDSSTAALFLYMNALN